MARYAFTIFLSAFLLFQVQPLMGKHVLPIFGGGPTVWTTCMLFFQTVLLVGYLYAHLISVGLRIRMQSILHLTLLLASLAMLPITPSGQWKIIAGGSPAGQILLLLLITVGGPYFLLSTTGPLMQRWFSRSFPGRSPYRLYALSNFGSLLALLSYPFIIEPALRLRTQDTIWAWGYVAFVALAAWCAIRAMRLPDETESLAPNLETETVGTESAVRPGIGRMFLWLGLSAMGSALLLATTNQMCINVAVVPFLWVLPLSLYLLTFVICFDNPRWYDRRVFGLLLALAAPTACWMIVQGLRISVPFQVGVYSAVMFAGCMACHGELAASRPHPRYLTLFYLLVSLGGVLGGLFVALGAPALFTGFWEYQTALGGVCLLTVIAWWANRAWPGRFSLVFWIWAAISAAQCGLAIALADRVLAKNMASTSLLILFLVYGVIVLLGWLGTAIWEDRLRLLAWLWSGVSAAQVAWIIVFCQWREQRLILPEHYIWLILGALAAPPLCFFSAYWSRRLSENRRRMISAMALQIPFPILLCHLAAEEIIGKIGVAVIAGIYVMALFSGFLGKKGMRTPYLRKSAWFWTPMAAMLAAFLVLLHNTVVKDAKKPLYASRNFYGVLRVAIYGDAAGEYYSLLHGQIEHGIQYLDEDLRRKPTTYYGQNSGVGMAIRLHPRRLAEKPGDDRLRVGIVGLGTGAIAAYGRPGDYYRFYEINPDVVALTEFFTYRKDSEAEVSIGIGDARMVMERELHEGVSQQFDILAVDAFNSDAIPVHLLTIECAEVYRRHLKPDGLLLFHISNRYLDLNPVVRAVGERLGWQAVRIESHEDDEDHGVYSATWVILTANEDFLAHPEVRDARSEWRPHEPQPLLWTDDFAGLWQVIDD